MCSYFLYMKASRQYLTTTSRQRTPSVDEESAPEAEAPTSELECKTVRTFPKVVPPTLSKELALKANSLTTEPYYKESLQDPDVYLCTKLSDELSVR